MRLKTIPACLLALLLTAASATSAASAPTARHLAGTLPDGATWIADVPADWNGTLVPPRTGRQALTSAPISAS